jgi:DMSO/TMAO reductase YedYZ heme-binding membrane subunit
MHGIDNLIDNFMWRLGFLDVFWFSFKSKPDIWLSLGTAGFYIMLIAVATSLSPKIIGLLKHKAWYNIHVLSYVAFVAVVVHSLLLGTDLNTAKLDNPISIVSFVVFSILVTVNVILFVLVMLRIIDKMVQQGREAKPR